ncbi:MAG: hypothetical protein KAT05_08125 [Spirochaetes bacterium]|nr:hypothetical protein [Spirochaetota bacterium]
MGVNDLKSYLVTKSRYIIFTIYIIVLIFIAFNLSSLFTDSKENGFLNTHLLNNFFLGFEEIWFSFITLCFGAFYGATIILLFFDKKKRIQAGFIVFASYFILDTFDYLVINHIVIFVLGLIFGGVISYAFRTKQGEHKKHQISTMFVAYIAIVAVWLELLNYILGESNTINSMRYLLLSVVFSIVFFKFMHYEVNNSKIFVVGPNNSGKTVFMCALYETALKQDITVDLPSENLADSLEILYNQNWPPGSTQNKLYNFGFEHGGLFAKDIFFNACDYSGEIFENSMNTILDHLNSRYKFSNRLNNIITVFLNNKKAKSTFEQIADSIYCADKLIFIIDPERRKETNEMKKHYIKNYYMKILRVVGSKPYYIVITKTDKLKNCFQNEENCHETIKTNVINEMMTTNPFFRELKRNAEGICPVCFFELNDKPELNNNNEFNTYGFDEVIKIVGN